MSDITALILADHAWFRDQFAALDYLQAASPQDLATLRQSWEPLSARLDLHAIAEETIFYPQLLRLGDDSEAETLDAIGDHNDIRDALHDTARHPIGTTPWWDAVRRARVANDEHMGEEEHEGLADFRLSASQELRDRLGSEFAQFLHEHRTTAGVDVSDKDPQQYVRSIGNAIKPASGDTSLGIGSLKGQ